jgi:hypothetical protein
MTIEELYAERLASMSPKERVARAAAMFQWSREMIGRQIIKEEAMAGRAPLMPEVLKWRIALRMYGADPKARTVIERRLADVSG